MRPNYMLIGAAKCGTTSICGLIGEHPEIFMVECKEPHFFSIDRVYEKGLAWYESLFDAAGAKPMRGEGSNSYTMKEQYPEALPRLLAYERDLKLIYVARDPLERIESFWIEKRSHGGDAVHHDFNRSLERDRVRVLDNTNYLRQIEPYYDHFPAGDILVTFFEDFKADPRAYMKRIYEFLGCDPRFRPPSLDAGKNPNPYNAKVIVSPLHSRLRSVPGYKQAVKLMPTGLRNTLLKPGLPFSTRVTARPVWKDERKQWALGVLRDDSLEFLRRYGKPADFWPSIA